MNMKVNMKERISYLLQKYEQSNYSSNYDKQMFLDDYDYAVLA